MYGAELIVLIVGIVLFIVNIVVIVKICQIANSTKKIADLYVDGVKELFDTGMKKYYKLPLEEFTKEKFENEKAESEKKEQKGKAEDMAIFYKGEI